jgi:hypothetical protein
MRRRTVSLALLGWQVLWVVLVMLEMPRGQLRWHLGAAAAGVAWLSVFKVLEQKQGHVA